MTPAEAGALGGAVCLPKPADFIQGNPDARKLALKCGDKSNPHTRREVVELYRDAPDVVTRLAEIFLEVIDQVGNLHTPLRRPQQASHLAIVELASIEWENIQLGTYSFRPHYLQFEIGLAADVMRRIWEAGPETNDDGA